MQVSQLLYLNIDYPTKQYIIYTIRNEALKLLESSVYYQTLGQNKTTPLTGKHIGSMKMTKISDNFCGYLNVGDDTFSYNVSKNVVTLLPAQAEDFKRFEVLDRVYSRNVDIPEFLYGYADSFFKIAILRNDDIRGSIWGLNAYIRFGTPLIVKASGNTDYFNKILTADWNAFHAITFYGGNINALCNPQMAVEQPKYENLISSDGAKEIKVRPWDDYTRSVDLEIDGEKATITISISQTGEGTNSEDIGSYSIGELSSFIRISFENAQNFDKIVKYYRITKSLVAILTMQNNVSFGIYLSQRDSNRKFFETGVCKIFDHYENYSIRKWHSVVPIHSVFDYVPTIINKIANNDIDPLLALLPENNKRANLISITGIQDLCTALEVAYDWSKRKKEKDPIMAELKKNIKQTITEFIQTHSEIDVYRKTTISNAFQYLDYTLKQKILTLFDENRDAVGAVLLKWSLPQVDEESVGSFVNLRNNKTHSGTFEWDDSANLYTALLALEYACLFKYIGLSDDEIKSGLLKIF